MKQDNNIKVFFVLLRSGLWGHKVNLSQYDPVDLHSVQALAEEQSVVGLVAAGLEHIVDRKPAKQEVLQYVGQTLQLEQKNTAMNEFIQEIIGNLNSKGIYLILLKGQGIAQCYERPLWRACGDVDFLLSEANYEEAKKFFVPIASSVEPEGKYKQHLAMTVDPWVVELHGSLRCGLSSRVDKGLDEIKKGIFGGDVRVWRNGDTDVILPSVESDAVYLFTHILGHFYKGGIGIRQVCDWCRLLWTYRDSLDRESLESRITKMGLISEWKAFGAFAVEYLGMPSEAMPMYSADDKWKRKADKICSFILEVGNFGHNRDSSYFNKYPFIIRKAISLCRRSRDFVHHLGLFPLDTLKFFPSIVLHGLQAAADGE